MTRRLRELRREDGVGIVELLVVTTLMGIIASIAAGGIIQSFSQQRSQMAYVETMNSVKQAFERTTRELRAADPLVAGSDHALTVRIRRAGTCRDMSFALLNEAGVGRLVTQDPVGAPQRTVARGLLPPGLQPTFEYRNENDVVLTPPVGGFLSEAQVRDVRIVTFAINARVRPGAPDIALRDTILLRNRGGRQC